MKYLSTWGSAELWIHLAWSKLPWFLCSIDFLYVLMVARFCTGAETEVDSNQGIEGFNLMLSF